MQGVSMADDYYTNLLRSDEQFLDGWDDSQHVSPIGTQPSPLIESSVPVRTNTKRTTSYKECEDNLLVSSWLNTSLDATIGAEQTSSSYWKRIHLSYHANKTFVSDRNMNSLMNHWVLFDKRLPNSTDGILRFKIEIKVA